MEASEEQAPTDAPISPTDLSALARHATQLAGDLERAWSDALDDKALEEAHAGITRRVGVMMTALTVQLAERDAPLEAAGVDILVPDWPVQAEQLLELLADHGTPQRRREVLVIAQLQAVELVVQAFNAVIEPTGLQVDLLGHGELARWWESGAFALLKSRARLLLRLSRNVEELDAQMLAGAGEPRPMPEAMDALLAAGAAYRRGDPEAALLHALRSASLRAPVGGDQPSGPGRWAALKALPDCQVLAELLQQAEVIVQDTRTGRPFSGAYAMPVAGELLAHLERFVLVGPERAQAPADV